MSFPDPTGPVVPEDAGLYAETVKHDLQEGGFRARWRPKHTGLAIIVGVVVLIALVFLYGAFLAPAEQVPEPPGTLIATLTSGQ